MFTQTTPHGVMISNYAITLAPVALQMTLRFLDGAMRPELVDALRYAVLLPWIPNLLIVQRSVHCRLGRPASAPTAIAVLSVVIVATAWAIATHDPITLELAPASTAIVQGGVTT